MNDDAIVHHKTNRESTRNHIRNQSLTLHIHTDESVFSTLDVEWTKLAHLSDQMICMSCGWAASWWKHFGRHKKRSLFIVAVYDNHRLAAIFPFYKGTTSLGGIALQQRLKLIGSGGSPNEQLGFSDDYGISDFLDFIVDPEYRNEIAELFIKLLAAPEFSGHQITLHQARDDSYIMQTLYPLLQKSDFRVWAELTDTCYYIERNRFGCFQDFIKKSKTSARRRFRQTLRAREIGKEYAIEEPAGPADVGVMIEKLIQLHQDRWNNMGYPGVFHDERFRVFFKEISIAAYREKRLWIKQAVDGGGICAVRMLLMYNERYYDYMSGFDADSPSARYRPGIGLLLSLVEDSFEMPIERIELLRGDEGYKHDFTDLSLNNWEITISDTRHRKTGWGVPAAIIQLGSILLKYMNREKIFLKVQLKKVGFVHMFSGYVKFRLETVYKKIKQ